ncbi:uncharacterized protein K460DRAFT_359748 [Cucurbitaria berberidis CBS 394.84]|uniref:Uncharacterized protein n=1 Tax=Cucurbitaria berberidis CBS 394.84 TaxID=1168544 RepID=A0A9P4L4E6_9PLEO|nr:uncharacterized protein K460DRAFT_359748 [Cucurbitaria berberidis CBS 394.84]KAF1841234.1 hypothetical protein K460DRAFT_359748 [Cucurbitaria berberidis CBS 394.84]
MGREEVQQQKLLVEPWTQFTTRRAGHLTSAEEHDNLSPYGLGLMLAYPHEAFPPASVDSTREDIILTPQNLYGGWVNPEDLTPMPQCIAQQDQSTWLSTMTKCTSKRCTRHFGIICTHHQWLTQLSCLSTEFSSEVVKGYLPHCSRSVLAKAQLYRWIHTITGRTWLVDVGDTNELQTLSPASLAQGYAALGVIYNAPACLMGSVSASSMEPFQHVMASCSFTSTTQHTGNTDRPWEYSESLHSMITLDSETVGYDHTHRIIRYGDYFDKDCLCGAAGDDRLERERLWISATCGPRSLPDNGTDGLKTTEFAYIPIEDWHWPTCVTDIPKRLTELTELNGQCATDACDLDSDGYCKVVRAVDRACFCRYIRYNSCGGSCHVFETRIDYVKWLHDLCGNVQDWHGLPDNWGRLAAPTVLDMIPWPWTIRSSHDSNSDSATNLGSKKAMDTCASTEWKLGSFALINIATFFAVFLGRGTGIHQIALNSLWNPHPRCWFSTGILIASFQLLANWLNAFLVQQSFGYENVPVLQLMLLWCAMPRLNLLTTLLAGIGPFKAMSISAAASSLFAEAILQVISSYYLILTVNYGREHDFYLRGMERLDMATWAKFMYAGALLWLIVSIVTIVKLLQAACRWHVSTGAGNIDVPKWQNQQPRNIVEEGLAQFIQHWARFEENLAHHGIAKSGELEETSSLLNEGGTYTAYGTCSVEGHNTSAPPGSFVRLYAVTVIGMLLLWIAQWLFWGGFIGLSLEEFCPPKLELLTAIWIAFSLASVTVAIRYTE